MTDHRNKNVKNDSAEGFYRVRQTLGYLAFFLPLILILSSWLSSSEMAPSISDFFHTFTRDIFVGIMTAIAIFLIVYRGYERQPDESFSDNWLATFAGITALGVAYFPNEDPSGNAHTLTQQLLGVQITPFVHYGCALLFFASLAVFCFGRFAKTKDLRNRKIFRLCGWIIGIALIGIFISSLLKQVGPEPYKSWVIQYNVVFWVEAIGVWAFSASWLIKGRADHSIIKLLKGGGEV